MRARWWCGCAVLVCALGGHETADASGYGIYEAGAAVMGMAGAGTASVNDASAVFYNPAVLARIAGTGPDSTRGIWYLGGSGLIPLSSFAGVNPYPGFGVTEEMNPRLFFLPAFYYARAFGPRWAGGVGVSSPYGLGVHWKDPDEFTGRYVVTKATLDVANLGISVAYQINPMVSVAAGGNMLFSKVDLENRILQPPPGGGGGQVNVAKTTLDASWKPGYGWNAAVSVTPSHLWKFGATYRGKVITPPSGDATFEQIPTGNAAFDAGVAASLPPDQGVSTVLRFPAIWAAGAAWTPTNWTVEGSLVFTEWSLFTDLPLTFDDPQVDRTIVENYDDAMALRFGAEHRLPKFTYRFGYYYEQEAAPTQSVTPLLPDAPRHGVTLGLGFRPWSNITLDIYNLSVFAENRSTEGINRDGYDGEYKTYVNATGLNFGFRW